jgi:hypothetical protein
MVTINLHYVSKRTSLLNGEELNNQYNRGSELSAFSFTSLSVIRPASDGRVTVIGINTPSESEAKKRGTNYHTKLRNTALQKNGGITGGVI